jgi:uncharacterized protein (TIGR02270 family)
MRTAVLLGNRAHALQALAAAVADKVGGNAADTAGIIGVALRALPLAQANAVVSSLAAEPGRWRDLFIGIAAAGDAKYLGWLIAQMENPRLTRAAGEAFAIVAGLDLAELDLDRRPPDDAVTGPKDDPEDDDVLMDPDEGLPWPDPGKISVWWQAHRSQFPDGRRFFMGEPPSVSKSVSVLKNGYQRQRLAAAQYLCLLRPGTALFDCGAPAWRQQRLLAEMG